jgi:beta-fructofuranosidase
MTVRYQPGTVACGVLLRADAEYNRYYQVRLEPNCQRLVVDRWPRPGDQPFLVERPLAMEPGKTINLRLLVDGTNLVVYANDRVALSCRLYDHREGHLGLFVTEGEATFMGVAVKTRA